MAKAIAARIETLDEAFLVTLQGFVQAAEAEGDATVAGLSGFRDMRPVAIEQLIADRSYGDVCMP